MSFDNPSSDQLKPDVSGPEETVAAASPESTDLRDPSFLHPTSILFDVLSHVRRFIFPAIVALYSAASGGAWGIGIAAVIFGGALATTVIRYFTLRYGIQGHDFVVTEGLLFRRVRSVPVRRIQNVDLVQNVLHRLFGVAEVRIETASGTEPEAILRVLTRTQIEELRQAIFGAEPSVGDGSEGQYNVPKRTNLQTPGDQRLRSEQGSEQQANTEQVFPQRTSYEHASLGREDHEPQASGFGKALNDAGARPFNSSFEAPSPRKELHRISLKQLIAAGLASNRGLVLLGIIFGLFFQNGFNSDKLVERLENSRAWENLPHRFEDYAPAMDSRVQLALLVVLGVVFLFLCLRIVGVAWYVLRFYDHQLTRQGNDLRISCGLFTRVSATVPRERIQFISVHRTLLMRWMGLASIRIETAGGGGADSEDAASTVSRRWFMPVIAEKEVMPLLRELRPAAEWDTEDLQWHALSPVAAYRLLRVAVAVSILLSGVGFWLMWPWGGLVGLVFLPLLSWSAIKKSRAVRYARTEEGVVYRSGVWTKKMSFAFYDRMQTIELTQSLFDRRWRMATLAVDTAAAGPADHDISIDYLDADFAAAQFEELQQIAAHHRPRWR